MDVATTVDDGSAVCHKLQAVFEELGFHVRHVLKLLNSDRPLNQLPARVLREVSVDKLVGVGQKEELVQLVVEIVR